LVQCLNSGHNEVEAAERAKRIIRKQCSMRGNHYGIDKTREVLTDATTFYFCLGHNIRIASCQSRNRLVLFRWSSHRDPCRSAHSTFLTMADFCRQTEEADMEPAVADEGRSTKMETQPPRTLGTTYFITS
jgi:hypothetical protein